MQISVCILVAFLSTWYEYLKFIVSLECILLNSQMIGKYSRLIDTL